MCCYPLFSVVVCYYVLLCVILLCAIMCARACMVHCSRFFSLHFFLSIGRLVYWCTNGGWQNSCTTVACNLCKPAGALCCTGCHLFCNIVLKLLSLLLLVCLYLGNTKLHFCSHAQYCSYCDLPKARRNAGQPFAFTAIAGCSCEGHSRGCVK